MRKRKEGSAFEYDRIYRQIYYLGIPWLTREVVAFAILILIALFAIIVLFCWRNIVYSSFVNLVLGLLVIMVCILVALQFWVSSWKDNTKVKPLSEISNVITVQNNKVTIDKLPDSNKKQVFKYEEDATFNSSYLVMESGKKYKLNEEDTKFLKEKGVK